MKKKYVREAKGQLRLPDCSPLSQHREASAIHMLSALLTAVSVFTKVGAAQTHSLSKGMDVLLLLFCTTCWPDSSVRSES